MKYSAGAFLIFCLSLSAADFWQSKPSSEWSEKDLQKMISNSPWAKVIAVPMSGPVPPNVGGAAGGGGGEEGPSAPISEGGGGRGGRGGGGAPAVGGPPGGAGASAAIVARWQSALPVKEALDSLKRGVVDPEAENSYLIVLSGALRPFLRGNPEAMKQMVTNTSSLSAKGKDTVKPSDIRFYASRAGVEIAFYFPRDVAYSLDDKEVEFSTRLNDLPLKYKFRLRDMVINGKLEI